MGVNIYPADWENISLFQESSVKARIGWQGLTAKEYLDQGPYGLVGGTDLISGFINWDSISYVEKYRFIQDTNIQLLKNDILVTKDGTIGKVAIVDRLPQPSTLNSGVYVIRPINNRYDSKFIYYLLTSNVFSAFINRLAAGSTISHLYQRDLKDFNVTIPKSNKEQKAIAKALSDIDELIAVTAQLLNKNERIFEGALQTEFSESSGATLTMVSDICEVTKGSAVKYDKNFTQGSFGFLNGGINFSGSTEFANDRGNTVVISEGGNSCGFVNYIPEAFWCGGHAYRLLGFKGAQKYLYYALKKSEKEIMNLRVGSGLPNVQKKNLSDFRTPIHQSSKKQEEVVNFLDSLTGEIDNLKAELAKFECLKQGMAHDLLTGKVRLV